MATEPEWSPLIGPERLAQLRQILRELGTAQRGAHEQMEALAPERQAQLTALLDELGRFPTPETIVHCMEFTIVDPTIETERARIDVAVAGAWAFDRMTSYLDRLRSLNEERMQLGTEIGQLKRHPYPKNEGEIEAAARAKVMAPILAGKQEVVYNFFCISVQHIRSLLLVLAESVGYPIPQDDLDFLDQFRFLRNHYEHWYSRLPGKSGEIGLFTKTMSNGEYHLKGGVETDAQNRIIVVEPKMPIAVAHIVDITNDGVERVERIVREAAEGAKTRAIENVRAYFIANPDKKIPPPESVDRGLLISV